MKDEFKKRANTRRKNNNKKKNAAVKVSAPLTKAIKTVVKRQMETKFLVGNPANYNSASNLYSWTAFTTAITGTSEIYGLIPYLTQGLGDNERVGESICPISLKTIFNVSLDPQTTSTLSLYVDIYILTSKSIKSAKHTAQIPINLLLNRGNGGNIDYDGTYQNSILPVNTTDFSVIKHKRIKLQKAADYPNSGINATTTPSIATYHYNSTFSVKVPLPSKLHYQSNADYVPENSMPFVVIGFTPTDTFSNVAQSTPRVYVTAQSQMYYKDA